ncbi:MAG TPA: hypothetical protein VGP99_09950 [Tepidisphaeraceae bacterium]|jgi:hypothetical protein|nr:hypothetical protein [Tepidisphaeraceae bacterium]
MDSAKANRIAITILIVLIITGTIIYLIYDQIQPKKESKIEVAVQDAPQQSRVDTIRSRKERPQRPPESLPPLNLLHLEGTPLQLADYSGKFVFLHIWSTSAPISLQELNDLKPIYDKLLLDSRVKMIGICADSDAATIERIVDGSRIGWLQCMAAPDASAATREFLSNPGLLILGKDGNIIERPQDWWKAFCLLGQIVPHIKPANPPGLVIDFEQLPNQPKSFVFKHIASPSTSDAATQARIDVIDGRLHGLSGPTSNLNDGKMPSTWDTPPENLFFIARSIEGRFVFDLQQSIAIKQINSYTWHAHERSPQVFRVYGADGTAPDFIPDPRFGTDPAKVGWTLIADVDTRPAPWPRGITGISIHQKEADKNLGTFRYLLFLAFPAETHDAQGHTFFGEIDVIEAK